MGLRGEGIVLERGRKCRKTRRVTGVLDIGTTKMACLIAAVETAGPSPEDSAPPVRVLGVGHQRARGVKAGTITDLDEAEQSLRAAIAQAERMAGVTLEDVSVSVACGRLKSKNFTANAAVESGVVTEEDLSRVLAGGQSYAEREGRTLIHMNEIGVRLDGAPGGRDPRGMAAGNLAADLHAVTVDEPPLRNLLLVIERCYLAVSRLVPAPYASARGVTTEEERRLGVTCVDIGGGTTTIAMFAEGRFLHASTAPVGGNHITLDIARALHTPLAEAERIKALYGTLAGAQSDEHEAFSYPSTGDREGGAHEATRARLSEIIRPRVRGLIALMRERIEGCEVGAYAGRSIVLTGGVSQLVGMAEMVSSELELPTRVGRPQFISGLPQVVSNPSFAVASGLVLAETEDADGPMRLQDRSPPPQGYLGRVGSWLRRGF